MMKDTPITTYEDAKTALYSAAGAGGCAAHVDYHVGILNCEYGALGLRIPVVRDLAKRVALPCRAQVLDGYFADGERLFETTLFAGCLSARKGDYPFTRDALSRVIYKFGSWAHVDTVVPCLKWTDVDTFLKDFDGLRTDGFVYARRTYIVYLMDRMLGGGKTRTAFDLLKSVRLGEYYVDMAAAWLIAEAVAKDGSTAVRAIENGEFPIFVHNKAIQKACESYRVPPEVKTYLKTLKRR